MDIKVIHALWFRNLKAFVRNKPTLIINLVFPFFFLFVLGEMFKNEAIENSTSFMLAGLIIATVFDSSLRVSTTTISDITGGFMKEVLVSPVSRLTVAVGQFLSAATIATFQGMLIYVVGLFIGIKITNPVTVLWVILSMIFIGLVFAGFGLLIATSTKNIQTFQAATMAIMMPMTFLSGAYIPLHSVNSIIRTVAAFNPLSYAVVLFRSITLEVTHHTPDELYTGLVSFRLGEFTATPAVAVAILAVFGVVFIILSTIAFIRVDFSKMNRNAADSLDDWG